MNQYTVLIHEIKNKERDKLSPSVMCVSFNGIRKLSNSFGYLARGVFFNDAALVSFKSVGQNVK